MEVEEQKEGKFVLTEGGLKVVFNQAVLHRWKVGKIQMQEIRLDDDKNKTIRVKDDYSVLGIFFEANVPFTVVYER